MKRFLALLILPAALFLAGCAAVNVDRYIPQISANSIEYHRTGTLTGADVSVTNIQQHPDKVTADRVEITVRYPFIGSVSVTATGYVRNRAPSE